MTPHPQQEWILPQKRLDELNQYFNNHKDDLIRIAWKNMLDDIHLHLCKAPTPAAPDPLCICQITAEQCYKITEEIKAETRNQTLDEVLAWCSKFSNDKYDMPSVRAYIKSLRTPSTQENQ